MKRSKNEAVNSYWRKLQNNPWLIGLLAFLLYAITIPYDYNLDDELVTRNHRLTSKGVAAIPDIFRSAYYEDNSGYRYEYRPMVLVSFAIEHSLTGDNPHVSHFINVVLYALLCWLILQLLFLLLPAYAFYLAPIAALFFVVHPLHTEVVASIKNRDELLAHIFVLLVWMQALRYSSDRKTWRLLFAFLMFNLAMLSKQSVLVLSGIIPLSLLLFTATSFATVQIIYLVVALAGLIWAPVFYLYQKVVLLIAGSAVLFTVMLFVKTDSWRMLCSAVADCFKRTEPDQQVFGPLQSMSRGALVVWILGIGAVVFGISMQSVAILSMGALLIASLFFSLRNHWLLDAGIMLILAFALWQTGYAYVAKLLLIAAAYFVVAHHGRMRLMAIPFLAGAGWVLVSQGVSSAVNLLLLVPFVFMLTGRFTRVTAMLFVASFAASVSVVLYNGAKWNDVFLQLIYAWLLLVGLSFFYPQLRKHLSPSLFAVAIGFIGYVLESGILVEPTRSYAFVWSTPSPNLSPVESVNRPIHFVEYPFDSTTTASTRIGTAGAIAARYTKLLLLPYPLSFYYGYSDVVPVEITSPSAVFGYVLLLSISLAGIVLIRKNPLLSFSLLALTASLLAAVAPVFPVPGVMADRFMFFAVLPVGLIAAWAWHQVVSINAGKPIAAVLNYAIFILLVVFAVLTLVRNTQWKNKFTLYATDVKTHPQSAQAHNLLALEYVLKAQASVNAQERDRMLDKAEEHLNTTLQIYPAYFNAAYDLARVYEYRQKDAETEKAYRAALKINPGFSQCWQQLGLLYEKQLRYDQAIEAYKSAMIANPANIVPFNNLSFLYYRQKRYNESIEVARQAIRHHPTAYEPVLNTGKIFIALNQMDSARYYFERARALNPSVPYFDDVLKALAR